MRPRPSDDPVMNTRATSYLLSSRRPFRLTIPNDLPASRVFPCTRHDAGEKVYAIQEEEGRPEKQHLQHWFALKQSSTPPPSRRLMQPQQRACRRYSRRDWSAARLSSRLLGAIEPRPWAGQLERTRQPGKAMLRATAAVRVGGPGSAIAPPARAWQAWPSNKREEPIYKK
jgi:hypothetical protein